MDDSYLWSTYHFREKNMNCNPFTEHQAVIRVVIMPASDNLYMGVFTPHLTVFTLRPADWDMSIDSRQLASIVLKCLAEYNVPINICGVCISAAAVECTMSTNNMYREMLFVKQNADDSKVNASLVQVFHSQPVVIENAGETDVNFIFYIMTKCADKSVLVQVNTESEDRCFPFEGFQPMKIAVIDDKDDPTAYIMGCLLHAVGPQRDHPAIDHEMVAPSPGITPSSEDTDELDTGNLSHLVFTEKHTTLAQIIDVCMFDKSVRLSPIPISLPNQ